MNLNAGELAKTLQRNIATGRQHEATLAQQKHMEEVRAKHAAELKAAQEKAAQQAQTNSYIQMGISIIGIAASFFSDEKLKTNIKPLDSDAISEILNSLGDK